MTDLRPFDGTAVILHLIEAARVYGRTSALSAPPEGVQVMNWAAVLESYLAAEIPADGAAGWEPRTWGEVLPGDRVSLGGVEADVRQAVVLGWHVEPDPETGVRQVWHPGWDAVDEESGAPKHCRGCKGRCRRGRGFQTFPLEHSQIRVELEFGGQVNSYGMPTGGEIEVLRGEAGRAADRACGRHADMVKADRDAVLAGWAAEAFETLAAAGLSPEPQAMTAPEVGA